jgi:hypothetical protein
MSVNWSVELMGERLVICLASKKAKQTEAS